jgi:hypothetical protein
VRLTRYRCELPDAVLTGSSHAPCRLSCHTVHSDVAKLYVEHIKKIREKVVYKDALIMVVVENNMTQLEPGRIKDAIDAEIGLCNIEFLHGKPETDEPGVQTTDKHKEDFVSTMTQVLSEDQLRFVSDTEGISRDWKREKAKLLDQLGRFRKCRVEAKTAGRKMHIVYTGKSSGRPDDAAMAAQMTLSWHKKTRVNPAFVRRCAESRRRY